MLCESKVLSSSSYLNISSFNQFLFIADNEKELKGHRAINKGKREDKM